MWLYMQFVQKVCFIMMHLAGVDCGNGPLKLHLTTSELWFGQEQEGILPELLSSSGIV